jgi:hypothetical protein
MRLVDAKGAWKWLLNVTDCAAVTMPWRTIYLLPEYLNHGGLIAHERVHLEQIEREGPVMFRVRYLWWLLRYGYGNHPHEVEAYSRAPL